MNITLNNNRAIFILNKIFRETLNEISRETFLLIIYTINVLFIIYDNFLLEFVKHEIT